MNKIMRNNRARAYELHLIGSSFFQDHYNEFKKKLEENTDGGVYNSNGIRFEFGKISRLIGDIPVENTKTLNLYNVKYIYHLDTLKAKRKNKLCVDYSINKKELKKADILAIGNENYLISVKDIKKPCKLGQRSRVEINDVFLEGGLTDEIRGLPFKEDIKFNDTNFSKQKFNELSNQNKKFAYFKKNSPEEWKDIVQERLEDSYKQLINLKKSLEHNKDTLIHLIKRILTDTLTNSSDFYIWLEPDLCKLTDLIDIIKQNEIQVNAIMYETKNKKSLIVTIDYNEESYGITKIEPAFDGARINTKKLKNGKESSPPSHTKGIIYYFQQCNLEQVCPQKSIWDLIQACS